MLDRERIERENAAKLVQIHARAHLLGPKAVDDDWLRKETGFMYKPGSNRAYFGGYVSDMSGTFCKTMLEDMARHEEIVIDLHSPGGSAFGGIAIYNMLRHAPQNITTNIVGLAYSAASIMFQAGDVRCVEKGAAVGIHRAWFLTYGNAEELMKQAEELSKVDAAIMEIYEEKAKRGAYRKIKQYMDDDTSIFGAEAVELGMADKVIDERPKKAKKKAMPKEEAAAAARPDEADVELVKTAASTPEAEVEQPAAEAAPAPVQEFFYNYADHNL